MVKISEQIRQLELLNPDLLPDLRKYPSVIIASDYGGQHKGAEYQTLSFLLGIPSLEWDNRRTRIRENFLTLGRRMAFKSLNDKHKQKALKPFLDSANFIPGLLATVAIHKSKLSLFEDFNRIDLHNPKFEKFIKWDVTSFEKLLRVIHFLCFFIGGLSREGQDIYWFTDQDEIVPPNKDRRKEVVEIFTHIFQQYIPHKMGQIVMETTEIDTNSRKLEDFVAIPDLAAGALSEVLTIMHKTNQMPGKNILRPLPTKISNKTKFIIQWLSQKSEPLKRMTCVINPTQDDPTLFNLKWLDLTQINYA